MCAPAAHLSQEGSFEPGGHRAALAALPGDLPALLAVVRGLLVHDACLPLYGLTAVDELSRQTLPLAARLDAVLAQNPAPLDQTRAPKERAVGTCRDYALMLCALLRHKGVPARLRCGFARYFTEGRFEDHWICEYWKPDAGCWAQSDAQLDGPQRRHLAIAFDTADLPRGQFLTAAEAWEACRRGDAAAARFGHGAASGAWFLRVNLARDLLALQDQVVSPWDSWREVPLKEQTVDAAAAKACDALAARITALATNNGPVPQPSPPPFWQL